MRLYLFHFQRTVLLCYHSLKISRDRNPFAIQNKLKTEHGRPLVASLLLRTNEKVNFLALFNRLSGTVQFSFQIFNAARQLSHIEAAPDKSGLVLLDYWVGLKRCLVIIYN